VEREKGRGDDLGLESEMSDLMMFWKCFAVGRERKKKVIDDKERREASGCGETWGE
jgi:hypothetical protein